MMKKNKITVVGSGYVGMSLSVLLAQHNDVIVLETDNVVDVDEVTGFVGVEAYGGIGFITAVAEVFAIVVVCTGQ